MMMRHAELVPPPDQRGKRVKKDLRTIEGVYMDFIGHSRQLVIRIQHHRGDAEFLRLGTKQIPFPGAQ